MKDTMKKVVATPVTKTSVGDATPVAAKETAKPVITSATAPKKEETVKATPVKAEPVKKEAPAVKEVKAVAAAKKAPAKKAAPKKTVAKKAEIKETVHIEFAGKSYTREDLIKSVKDIWKYDYKKKAGDLKSIELYVKPEESKAYYVINGEVLGDFNI